MLMPAMMLMPICRSPRHYDAAVSAAMPMLASFRRAMLLPLMP